MKTIILAGGSGSRLWPLSREMYPKQLFTVEEDYSLLQQTFLRAENICFAQDILTITNVKYYQDIKLQLDKISKGSIVIAEPQGKNTAPAIACGLEYFNRKGNGDETVLILPSDHIIKDIKGFQQTVERAKDLADKGFIVTFGIKPVYAETGFGYIKTEKDSGGKVEEFIEKPDSTNAVEYVNSDNYYWNSGIFMAKISVLLEEYKKFVPDVYRYLNKPDFCKDNKISYGVYEFMPSISIDYAIMEHTHKAVMVELQSDWDDLGSWISLYNVKQKDENGNVLEGKVVTENVKNSFIYSQKELVAATDLEDIVIVETEDAIMACSLKNTQNVKKLYEKLKTGECDLTKLHKTVFRPWGYYTCMNRGEGYLTKTICVLPKQKLSIQSHNHRSEHWVVLEGKALVVKGEKEYHLNPGDSIDIPVKEKHSLQNPYETELKIIEVQKGNYISEDDIIRYQDCYGRV